MTDPQPAGTRPPPEPGGAPPLRRLLLGWALAPCLVAAAGWLAGGHPAAAQAEATAAAARVEPGWAYRWLSELQERFPYRTSGSTAQHGAVALITSSLRAAGLSDVSLEALPLAGRFQVNVLARIPGRDRSRRVVLAAHHDVVAGAPGAIDDGGAIAAILAAARSLHAGPPPACDVQLCVFDGEERGLLGSKAHLARQGAEGRAGLKAAVAVELVGWREDRLLVHTIPHGFAWNAPGIAPAWLAATVRRAADWADAPVGLGDPYASPWVQATVRLLQLGTGSDAGAYSARGLPAVMLSGSALTNFYEAYHLPGDAMDQVDPARLDDAARVLAAAAVELAALPADSAPPRLGTAYLTLGSRTLGAWTLRAIGLLAAMALVVAGAVRQLRGVGQAATFVAAAALAGLAAIPSVVGVLVVTPMALSAVAAPALPRGRRLLLYAGLVPLVVELALGFAAAAAFGLVWRGSTLESALLLVAVLAAPGAQRAATRD